MKSSSESIKAFLACVSMVYFFSPVRLIGESEIYPWYYLITLLVWPTYWSTLIVFMGLATITSFAFFDIRVAYELAQLVVVFTFLLWYQRLSLTRSTLIVFWIKRFLLFLVIFMILQKLFPNIFGPLGGLLNVRELGVKFIDTRTGGVRGIAPEQSYMAMCLIGIAVVIWFEEYQLRLKDQLLVIVGIVLCGSIVGYAALFILLILCNQSAVFKKIKVFISYQRISRNLVYLLPMFIIAVILLAPTFSTGVTRFLNFLQLLFEAWDGTLQSILYAEKEFGSDRIQELLEPLTQLCCGYLFSGEFNKSVSLYGTIWEFIAPLHLFFLYFVFHGKQNKEKINVMEQ
jgi:hypothetical protein